MKKIAVINFKGLNFGLIVLAFLFSFSNCKKENQIPSCTITYPDNGDEFEHGDTIAITVEANDNDGLIAEVNFYIDDVGTSSSSTFPYKYNWNTSDETIGNHIIKVIAKDNDGGSKTDDCTILIIGVATVVTTEADSITHNSAIIGGNITDDGGTPILERGVCWNTSQNPTLSNEHTTNGNGSGSFVSSMTELSPDVTYYVRAYATNSTGTAYGNEVSFITAICTGTFTDSRDGEIYNWVKIGNQAWMAENLAYLPSVSPPSANSCTDPYYYVYDYQGTSISEAKATNNYLDFGVLYNWPATMAGATSSNVNPSGIQGVCPDGWHVPSDSEWKELEIFLGMSQVDADTTGWKRGTNEGEKLKSIGFGYYSTNVSGFTAVGSGLCYAGDDFDHRWSSAYFWSATERGDISYQGVYYHAWLRSLGSSSSKINRGSSVKNSGFSVRCIKDD